MDVTLTPQAESRIRDLIEIGPYRDAAAVIDRALEVLADQELARFEKLRELVLAGFASGNRIELTDEVWDEMERRAEERFLRGEKPSPHVCP